MPNLCACPASTRGKMLFMNKNRLVRSDRLGNLHFDDTVICLAPMAGNSTQAYREICHEFGSTYAPTELVSARSIVYGGTDKSFRYLMINPESEGITAIQLFGFEPEDFRIAAQRIIEDERLSAVDIIDINMGCPVPKVMKTGSGSALLKDPLRAAHIVEAVRGITQEHDKVCTVKMRTGLNEFSKTGSSFASEMVRAGAQAICVHGRTASQMYHGAANIDDIAEIREAVASADENCFFIANGDIKDGMSAMNMLKLTDADGLMIGRAAIGNPWIMREVRAFLAGEEFTPPTALQRCSMLLRHLRRTAELTGEDTAVREMRSVMPHYITGLPDAAAVKVQLCRAATIREVEGILKEAEARWNF